MSMPQLGTNYLMEIAEDILIISVVTLTPLFGSQKGTNFTDVNHITIDILFPCCAKLRFVP